MGRAHLSPGIENNVLETDDRLEVGYVCLNDEDIPISCDFGDLFARLFELRFVYVCQRNTKALSIAPKSR